jgi:hypothetical protein
MNSIVQYPVHLLQSMTQFSLNVVLFGHAYQKL